MTEALVRVLGADQRIVADIVTGKPIGYTAYAQSYLDYLQNFGELEERHDVPTPDIPVWNFIYTRGRGWWTSSEGTPPAWRLGEKSDSTTSVLFGLALGAHINTSGWDLFFYPEEQILTTASGGQHRSLAHMLWGKSPPTGLEVDVYHTTDRADPDLNQALLLFESILPINTTTRGLNKNDFTRAKELYLSTPSEDRSLIARFLSSHRDTWMSSRALRGHQRMCECMSVFNRRRKMLGRLRDASSLVRQRLGAENPFYGWLLSQLKTH
ncbi:MAG: hypothetical protein EOO71_04695 [Myxococcaceae bacterium]|nr:MAG: hypothetical protein EOO71_04695 [Myxococcaceae bacterium]